MRRKKITSNIFKSGGNIPVVASIIVLVAFIAGLLLGSLLVAKSSSGGSGGTFADGWNAAKAVLKKANLPGFNGTTNLGGQVKSINGNKITFSTYSSDPLLDKSLAIRTVIVSNDTVITIQTQIPQSQFQANQQAGQEKISSLRDQANSLNLKLQKCSSIETATSTCGQERQQYNDLQNQMMEAQRKMMNMFTTATGTVQDIAVGDNISAVSASDISEAAQFAAKQIFVNKNIVPTTPATTPSAPVAPTKQ